MKTRREVARSSTRLRSGARRFVLFVKNYDSGVDLIFFRKQGRNEVDGIFSGKRAKRRTPPSNVCLFQIREREWLGWLSK